MIKGIHRQMIEVTHTGSPYFERAFLVVRGDMAADEEKLRCMAQKVVEQADHHGGLKRQKRRQRLRQAALALLWGGGGAALMWVLERLG
ncbi:MAG: hypothetical protein IJN04_04905 [Clostridia bacterium]|nr:hypothetical protein [Clostridia bacterium]